MGPNQIRDVLHFLSFALSDLVVDRVYDPFCRNITSLLPTHTPNLPRGSILQF